MVGGPDMANTKDDLGETYYMRDSVEKGVVSLDENLLKSYLAGLFEGDGHIWIQNKINRKKHNARFCITFGMKNEALAKKLLQLIGYGFIRYKLQDNACVLTISPVQGLKKVISLLNGELITPKIDNLHKLIDWLNTNHNAKIDKLPLKKGYLSEDSWLSGFFRGFALHTQDSDGSFSVQYTKVESGLGLPTKKRKISCRLRIEQRMFYPITYESYFNVLTDIASFLNCSLLTRKQNRTGNEYYVITASSKTSLSIIIRYLESNSLYSSKYLGASPSIKIENR